MLSSFFLARSSKEVILARTTTTPTKCLRRNIIKTSSSQSQVMFDQRREFLVHEKRYVSVVSSTLQFQSSSYRQQQQQQQQQPKQIARQASSLPRYQLSKESVEKVDALFKKILWLDLVEVHLLTELVNEKLGLHLTPKQRQLLQKAVKNLDSDGVVEDDDKNIKEEVQEKKKLFELKLLGFEAKSKIKVIKEIRSLMSDLGLKEAKELVESAPKVIQKDLSEEQAQEMKQKLEEVGAQVEML